MHRDASLPWRWVQVALAILCLLVEGGCQGPPRSLATSVGSVTNCLRERPGLFRVVLYQGGDPAKQIVIEGGASCRHAVAEIRLVAHDTGRERSWNLEVIPAPGFGVFEVEFPRLYLRPISGPDRDRLIVPYQSGLVIDNLLTRPLTEQSVPHHVGKHVWYGSYGTSFQSLQCLLYDDGMKGVMLWTQDPGLRIKDFEVSRIEEPDGTHLVASVHHYPDNTGRIGAAWRSPYPVLATTYQTGWQEAAERYRDWAWRQPWCAGGGIAARVRAGELPEWYLRSPLWAIACTPNNQPMLEKLRELLPGVETAVFLTQWQRHAFDELNPEYFPPKDEPGYRRMIAAQGDGIHLFPYINIQLIDTHKDWTQERATAFIPKALAVRRPADLIGPEYRFSYDHYLNYKAFWGVDHERTARTQAELRAAWQGPIDEALLGRILAQDFPSYSYLRKNLVERLRSAWGKDSTVISQVVARRTFLPMCRANPDWQDFIVELASRNLTGYGTDGHYMDESIVPSLWTCWAEDHGHAPGFGGTYLQGTRTMMLRTHQRNPGKVLAGECMGEWLIGVLEDGHCLYPTIYDKPAQLPLFQQVYHGHFSSFAWPVSIHAFARPEDLAAELHTLVHHGFKVGFPYIEMYIKMVEPANSAGLDIIRNTVMALLATADASTYGQRLTDPVISGARPLTYRRYAPGLGDPAFTEVTRPAVIASQWRALDGSRRIILLSNSSAEVQVVRLKDGDLAAGAILRDAVGGTRFVAANEIELPPLCLIALVVEP